MKIEINIMTQTASNEVDINIQQQQNTRIETIINKYFKTCE